MTRTRLVDAEGNALDPLDLFGKAPLSSGPYRLIEVQGVDGIWKCRHCRAYFLATVPAKPSPKCAKCGAEA